MRKIPNIILATLLYTLFINNETTQHAVFNMRYYDGRCAIFFMEFLKILEAHITSSDVDYLDKPQNSAQFLEMLATDFSNNDFLYPERRPLQESKQRDRFKIADFKSNLYTYKRNFNRISVLLPKDNMLVKKKLEPYLKELCNDNIQTENNEYSWEKKLKLFRSSINKDYILKSYKITDSEFIDVILYVYINNLVKIQNISFKIDTRAISCIENPLFITNSSGEFVLNENFNGYDFSCCLDLTDFVSSKIVPPKKTEKEPEMLRINKALDNVIQKRGLKGNGQLITFAEVKKIINDIRSNDNKLSDKRYTSYVSTYNKWTSGEYFLGRKEHSGYPIIKKQPKEDIMGKMQLESIGK